MFSFLTGRTAQLLTAFLILQFAVFQGFPKAVEFEQILNDLEAA